MVDIPSEPLSPGLYIVATPIGNLGDVTFRAAETLKRCDAVACEDTRVTGKLLKHLGISKPLWRYDDHSDHSRRERILEAARSQAIALVTDAGTPMISDPGYRLVREARAEGIGLTSLPGPSAAITAITLAGLPSDRFIFAGFLPVKEMAREKMLIELGAIEATLVFYETGPRLVRSLEAIDKLWPNREIAVARELTKLHEECRTADAKTLAAHYRDNPPKGEIVLIIGPPAAQEAPVADTDALLREALLTEKPSRAAGQVAKATGIDRSELYKRALELRAK